MSRPMTLVFPWLTDAPLGQYDFTEERKKVFYLSLSYLPQRSLQYESTNLNRVGMYDSYGKIKADLFF